MFRSYYHWQKWCQWKRSRSEVKGQGHRGKKIADFDPYWAFPDCNSRLNLPMATKWCTKLEVGQERCPIVFKVIHQISRPHGTEIRRFWPELSVSGLYLQLVFTGGFQIMHNAWCSKEEEPYCFSRSSVKFQGYMGKKIDDLNPILSKITRPVAAIKSFRFALLY